jgi:hypothetical protein
MNKILAGLVTALLLFGIADFAGATPLGLNYSVTSLGSWYNYDFELILDNNDGSWAAGQAWNWLIFGDQVRYSSPLTGFVGSESDLPVGPWTYYFTTQGVHNGPTFGDYRLSWIPTSIGETLSWSGISTAYLAQGELLFSTLGSLNGAVMADFETANLKIAGSAPVPEPATMLLFSTGLIGLAGLSRKFKKKYVFFSKA